MSRPSAFNLAKGAEMLDYIGRASDGVLFAHLLFSYRSIGHRGVIFGLVRHYAHNGEVACYAEGSGVRVRRTTPAPRVAEEAGPNPTSLEAALDQAILNLIEEASAKGYTATQVDNGMRNLSRPVFHGNSIKASLSRLLDSGRIEMTREPGCEARFRKCAADPAV